MARLFIIITLMLYGSPLWAGEPAAMLGADVTGLLQYLEENSAEINVARLESAAATHRSVAAGVLPDPSVRIEWEDINRDGGVTLIPSRVGGVKYTYLQPLPGWGKRGAQRDIAEAGAKQMQEQQRGVRAEQRSRMKLAFAQYYRAYNALQLNKDITSFAASAARLAQERYERGLSRQQEWIKAQLDEASLQSERYTLQAELRRTQARINALLNRPGSAPLADPQQLALMPSATKLEDGYLQQRLHDSSPQLFSQSAQSSAAQASYELTQRNLTPDFVVALSPIQRGDSISSWNAMLEFSIPLQQGAHSSHRHEAAMQLSASQAREQALAQALSGDMSEHGAALRAASEQLQLIRTQTLPLTELTYNSALSGYQNGTVDYATLWQARREVQRNRVDELDALLAQQIHLAEIERLTGEEL